MAREICHLVAIIIEMNKMAEGDKYLGCLAETLETCQKQRRNTHGGSSHYLVGQNQCKEG